MTTPLWVLLAFAVWTLAVVGGTIGSYRWLEMLARRESFASWGEYRIAGAGWYRRAMRAHANCVENLPVYGALVLVMVAAGVDLPSLDLLAVVFLAARVLQTTVHVAFPQTDRVVLLRSAFFHVQWLCMVAMAAITAWHAVHPG